MVDALRAKSSSDRVCEYLSYVANLAKLGAELHLNGRSDHTWTEEERVAWNQILDVLDNYHLALSSAERKILEATISPIISAIANGEWEEYLTKMSALL